jgi:hypothetical protein
MGQSNRRQCIECGQRALSIATRCPGCGREFPASAEPEGGPDLGLGRFLSPRVAAWVLAAAAVLTAAMLGRTSRPLSDSGASSEVGYSMGASTLLDTAATLTSPAEDAGRLLVAQTWASVRKSPSKSASLEAVLTPGDTVVADLLERGWYRVALEGEVLGYAHRSTLAVPGTEPGMVMEDRPGS